MFQSLTELGQCADRQEILVKGFWQGYDEDAEWLAKMLYELFDDFKEDISAAVF